MKLSPQLLYTILACLPHLRITAYATAGAIDEHLPFEDQDPPTSLRGSSRRILSLEKDYTTQESVVTYNGQVPLIDCPKGFYRPLGGTNLKEITGQRSDGCQPCPRGRYGSTEGLTVFTCTGPCPAGKYGDQLGYVDINQCIPCPPGTYGTKFGMTYCNGKCPKGKYSDTSGNTNLVSCMDCPTGYRGWQCTWAVQPRFGQDQDHQHKEEYGLKSGFKDPLKQTTL